MNATGWTAGVLACVLGCLAFGARPTKAPQCPAAVAPESGLSAGEVALVRISAHTARGSIDGLDAELREGLGAGLTVSQIKAALEQLYAYCGFPRSLNAIARFAAVVDDRKQQGVHDLQGVGYTPLTGENRYERGRATLENLTRTPQARPAPGLGEFSPEIDRFLKEHLFADIFENPVLSYRERELVTIAALASMEGVEAQLNAHIKIGRNSGITDAELVQVADCVERSVSRTQANGLRKLLGVEQPPIIDSEMLVRISEIEIGPDARDEYLAILVEEARKSVESEPGVICIFPMTLSTDPTQIRVVEIYRNRAAYEAHLASLHFQDYKSSTLQMVDALRLVDMIALDGNTIRKIFEKLK